MTMLGLTNPVAGKNLRYLRRKYRLSRRSLALLLGVEPKLIRQTEARIWPQRGIDFPLKAFMRLQSLFQVDINRIIREDLKHPMQ